jgi:hypothetical protein
MAATLSLDTITSSGAGITIDATKTFTVNGTLLTTGSTNVLHKTGDYPIVTGDVASKSELIITTTTATPRDITLPLVGVTGAATCVITVVVSADATGTNSVRVMNGASEAWTGYQKGDFVRFCVSAGAWVVLDHKETMFSSRSMTGNQSIAGSAEAKVTGFTDVTDIGGIWDNANNKLVAPFAGIWNVNWRTTSAGGDGNGPSLYVGGSRIWRYQFNADAVGYNYGSHMASLTTKLAASTDIEFYAFNGYTGAQIMYGNAVDQTGFDATFVRTY